MPKSYSEPTRKRAYDLFIGGQSKSAICARPDMPTRPTLDKWIREGEFTDGVPWDQHKEAIKDENLALAREKILQKRAETDEGFLEELKNFISGEAFDAVMVKFQEGDFKADANSLKILAETFAMLDNQASEKLEFAEWFIRQVVDIVLPIMDEQQFALFKNKTALLQHSINIKLNPLSHADSVKQLAA